MKPIRTRHHKKWDERIQAISGGMTILSSARGKWTFQGVEYPEKVIPVRIMCSEAQMKRIVQITIEHYRQKAVMYYVLSNQVFVVNAEVAKNTKPESKDTEAVRKAKELGWWLVGHKNVECYWYNGESKRSINWDKPLIDQLPPKSTGNPYDDDEWLSQRYRSDGSRI
jgi:hypothetical protein